MDRRQSFPGTLISPVTIGTISTGKDINNKTYYGSWTNRGGSNGSGGGNGGWSNGSGGNGRRSDSERTVKFVVDAVIALLIILGAVIIRMAASGELDIKFLRGSEYIGSWSYESINYTSDGLIYNDAEDFYLPCDYDINKDGTFRIVLNGEDASGSWTKSEVNGVTVLFLTYDEGTSSEIESLIQDNAIYYIRTNNMMEVYERKGDMFFVLNGYDPEETAYVLFRKE